MKYKLGELCDFEKGNIGILNATPGDFPLVVTGAERKTHNEFQFDTKAVCIPLVSSAGHGKKSLNYVHYQEGKFALGTILTAVIPKNEEQVNAKFLQLYLYYFKDTLIVPLMKGAANVSLAIKDLKELEIPLPTLEKQLKIIELENIVTEKLNRLHGLLKYQNNEVEKLKQTILQDAIQGKLTAKWRIENANLITETGKQLLEKIKAEKQQLIKQGKLKAEKPLPPITDSEIPFEIPDTWELVRLKIICSKIGSGSTPNGGDYFQSGFPFFRSQNIQNYGLLFDDIKFISYEIHSQMNGTVVFSNDLLLNITGGSLGRCALVPNDFGEGNVSQHVCIIRPILMNNSFFHKLVLSPFFQELIFGSTTGAGREGLPKYNLELFPIPLPPLSEQQAIVEIVEKLFGYCDALEKQISEREKLTETLMQAAIKELL